MNIIEYELIEDLSILFRSKVVLYGTGYWAKQVFACLKEIGIHPEIICQTEVTEDKFYNFKVNTLSNVLSIYDDDMYLLIIASDVYYDEMMELCAGSRKIKICTLYGFYTSIKLHVDEHILPEKFEKKVKAGIYTSRDLYLPAHKTYVISRFVQSVLLPEKYVWIYQPGKVGSLSIQNAILDRSVHIHTISAAYWLADIEKEYLDYYIQLLRNKKIKIISAVREPISRDIAAFFQSSDEELWPFQHYNYNVFPLYGEGEKVELKYKMDEFEKRYPQWKGSLNKSFGNLTQAIMHYKQDIYSWFDYEINRFFGVDVYSYPFDKEKGYTIIEKDNVQILLLKMECLSSLEKIIGEFIGDAGYRLGDRNTASKKIYRYAYKKFKESVNITPEYFNYYYGGNCKYEHFYSLKEIKDSYKYWEKHVIED